MLVEDALGALEPVPLGAVAAGVGVVASGAGSVGAGRDLLGERVRPAELAEQDARGLAVGGEAQRAEVAGVRQGQDDAGVCGAGVGSGAAVDAEVARLDGDLEDGPDGGDGVVA